MPTRKAFTLAALLRIKSTGPLPTPVQDASFLSSLPAGWTFTRASTATNGFYTDAPGSSYTTVSTNVPKFLPNNGGMLFESQARTNYLLNSATPATLTTGSLTTGWTMILWVIGTGSATVTAGTGAASGGLGTATAGTPLLFTVTTTGTFVVTKTGSLDRWQLERGGAPTSFIVTTAAIATRAAEVCNIPLGAWFDGTQGTLYGEATWLTSVGTNNQGICALSDLTTNNRIFVSQNGSPQFLMTTATVALVNISTGVPIVVGAVNKMAMRYLTTISVRGAANGVLIADQSNKTLPTCTYLELPLGAAATLGATSVIRRVSYFNTPLSDGDLQRITT